MLKNPFLHLCPDVRSVALCFRGPQGGKIFDCHQFLCQWWDDGMVMYLGKGADLHMVQLMPLPLTISCSSKSRLVLLR